MDQWLVSTEHGQRCFGAGDVRRVTHLYIPLLIHAIGLMKTEMYYYQTELYFQASDSIPR